MNYIKWETNSAKLGHQTGVDVLIPDAKRPKEGWPVLYLLHGYSGSSSTWIRYTQLEQWMRQTITTPFAIVMPDARNSFYTDSIYGDYWTYISSELPYKAEQVFGLSSKSTERFVAGFSMGGFGAMKLALNHPDFCEAVYSISGALGDPYIPILTDEQGRDLMTPTRASVFGARENFQQSPNNLQTVALRMLDGNKAKPKLWIYCGKDDVLIEQNRSFSSFLVKHAIDHHYIETDGEHTYDYLNQMLPRILQNINIKLEHKKV